MVGTAPIDVPGTLLAPAITAPGMTVEHQRDQLIIKVTQRGKDAVAGTLRVPYVARGGHVRIVHRRLPPAEGWTDGDLRVMWEASARLSLARRLGLPVLLTDRAPLGRQLAIDWETFDACTAAARALIARWPQVRARQHRRAPVEQPVGLEDASATERALARGRLQHRRSAVTRRLIAAEAMFMTRERRPWRSARVTAGSRILLEQIDRALAGLDSDIARDAQPLTAPIRTVMRTAADPRRQRELQPSSWPPLARRYYAAARIAATSPEGHRGRGSRWTPACRVWQVYEDWVYERLAHILRRVLGKPASQNGPNVLWHPGRDIVVSLRHQPLFAWLQPTQICEASWRAVVGRGLQPDAVLAVRDADSCVRLLAIDAKDRRALDSASVAVEGSKYLWGLRRADALDETSLHGVVLVAPDGGDEGGAPTALGRIRCVAASPFGRQGVSAPRLDAAAARRWLTELGCHV